MREIVAGGYCGRKIDGLGSLLGLLVHPLGFLGRCCCLTILKKKGADVSPLHEGIAAEVERDGTRRGLTCSKE